MRHYNEPEPTEVEIGDRTDTGRSKINHGKSHTIAYCSRVEVHAKEGFVLHYVEVAKNPNNIGKTWKRWSKFEGPNRLILRIDSTENTPPVVESTLVWERVEDSGN